MPELDGLRGLATALVMLHHFTIFGGMQPEVPLDRVYYEIARTGWIGVDIFFVLSGFLVTGILVDTKGHPGYFRHFYGRRVLRIFPLYFAVLAALFIVLPALQPISPAFRRELQDQAWYWTYLVNVRTALEGWPKFRGLGHFWSLAVEEQFYLVWPVIVLLAGRRLLLWLSGAFVIAGLLLRTGLALAHEPLAAYVLMPARMDSLAVGAAFALAIRNVAWWQVARRWAPIAGAVAVPGLLGIGLWKKTVDPESFPIQTVGFMLTTALAGALLVTALAGASEGRIRRLLASRILRRTGRYSYALYIFHNLLVFRITNHLFSVSQLPRIGGSQLAGQLLFLVTATALSFGLAWLSWHGLEQPFLRLKRFLPYRVDPIAFVSASRASSVRLRGLRGG